MENISELKNISSEYLRNISREFIIASIQLTTGMRLGDVINIKVRNIIFTSSGAIVNIKEIKTKREQVYNLDLTLAKLIYDYISTNQLDLDNFYN